MAEEQAKQMENGMSKSAADQFKRMMKNPGNLDSTSWIEEGQITFDT